MDDKYIGLIRVSTEGQEDSQLGLLAGRDDIDRYVEATGGEVILVLEEIESGKHDRMIKRPILLKALALCKRHRAILLVPKVDRLVRSTQVHSDIKRSGVKFRACDNPHANEFTLDILVAVAANEARAISDRTRKALKAYKDHGKVSPVQMARLIIRHCPDIPAAEVESAADPQGRKAFVARYRHLVPVDAVAAVAGKLGARLTGATLTRPQQALGRAVAAANRTRNSIAPYDDMLDEMRGWRAVPMTLQAIADKLNERGDRRRDGALWGRSQVKRLLDRSVHYRRD